MDQSFPDSKAMCLDFSCRLYRSRKARRLGKRSWMTLSSSIKCRIPWGKEDVLFAKIEADHQQVKPFFMTFYIAPVEGEKINFRISKVHVILSRPRPHAQWKNRDVFDEVIVFSNWNLLRFYSFTIIQMSLDVYLTMYINTYIYIYMYSTYE